MSNITSHLFYTDNFLTREEAIKQARRLRKAEGFAEQHIKCVVRDEPYEDYVLIDGQAHWYLRTTYFIEVLVHRESMQIPF